MQKRLLKISITVFLICLCVYFLSVFILPLILNSPKVKSFLVNKIEAKTETKIYSKNFRISISPYLHTILKFDDFKVLKDNEILFTLSDLKCDFSPLNFKNDKIYIQKFYLQKNNLLLLKNKKSSKIKFDIIQILLNSPDIVIDDGLVEFGAYKDITSKICFDNFELKGKKDKELSFNLFLDTKNSPNKIKISKENKIKISNSGIETKDYLVNFGTSELFISGLLHSYRGADFYINGTKIPVHDIEKAAILAYRYIKRKKHFLENFSDFKGEADINLHSVDGYMFGNINMNNLSAVTVLLSVPMSFKKAEFVFDKKDIIMKTNGKLGMEDVDWSLFLTGLFTDNLTISGSVSSYVSNSFAKVYIDKLKIKEKLYLNVDYLINNGIVDVVYTANLPVGSDLSYYGANLGLINSKRTFQASTRKKGDDISLVNYSYSLLEDKNANQIIFGSGDFKKINGKYTLSKLFGYTKKNAPVSLLGFLDDRLSGGFFNGNLEYDLEKKKIIGSVILENTAFKKFKIQNAAVFGDEKFLSILSNGTYKGEPFTCDIDIFNQFDGKAINIENLSLYLKKYVLIKKPQNNGKHPSFNVNKIKNYPKINVKNVRLRLDTFVKDKITAENLELTGSVKKNVLTFLIESVYFAKGKLSATGYADPNIDKIDVLFMADDIDSNIAAYQLFNLKDQFEGRASVKLHLILKNKLHNILGEGEFRIKDGYLPKINSTEFVINNSKKNSSKKIMLSKIVKIHKSVNLSPHSNITGRFKLNDARLYDISLYMQNNSLSLYGEGEYNRKTENANIVLWGKYDKDIARKISVFHIPLSWLANFVFSAKEITSEYIEKFKKTPDIKAEEKNTEKFLIEVLGNVNDIKSLEKKLIRIK